MLSKFCACVAEVLYILHVEHAVDHKLYINCGTV